MDQEEKIKNGCITTKFIFGFTCVVLYFSLIFFNYNMPVLKQILAHTAYVPIETDYEPSKRGGIFMHRD